MTRGPKSITWIKIVLSSQCENTLDLGPQISGVYLLVRPTSHRVYTRVCRGTYVFARCAAVRVHVGTGVSRYVHANQGALQNPSLLAGQVLARECHIAIMCTRHRHK